MVTEHTRQFEMKSQYTGDDFTQIQGIGPAIAERLRQVGILSFIQLAELTPGMLAAMFVDMVGISPARIQQQDWIGQARHLAQETLAAPQPDSLGDANNRQRYAVFTVELLLDKDNQVRRTRAMHVQSQKESSWAGWNADDLGQFMLQKAGVQLPAFEGSPSDLAAAPVEVPADTIEGAEKVPPPILSGVVRLGEPLLVSRGEVTHAITITDDQPYHVRLELDLSGVEYPSEVQLHYQATLFAHKFGTGTKYTLGEGEGTFALTERYTIDVRGKPLEQGAYRLELLVMLSPESETAGPAERLVALSEGKLLNVN